ncbi:hypothetical protein I316_07241 [Kwoniella heveanensis BCC8398]|uniref:Amidase domain-containing protein n=1 Tax=Kwoniella heveanensis BCC8398 TaxID=1296120 RepID=A0A1B9GJ89_9TREE|nr:hypothetical protein I316_07241 [Kwoniella heveanensis BCC8398]
MSTAEELPLLSTLSTAFHSTPSSLSTLPAGLILLQTSFSDLQAFLTNGSLTSVQLVQADLDNIERDNVNGLGLRAVIQTAPMDSVLKIAQELDDERKAGEIKGALHGIPILVKDNIATDPSLGMDTTAGSLALKGSKVPRDAFVVDALRSAGAIVIGKTNLSELAGWKGVLRAFGSDADDPSDINPSSNDTIAFRSPTNGWSAVGGQTSSAYVEGGFEAGADPMGSSSGSAVGVSAGWAAASLGTDTMGSVLGPAARADLYAIRPTIGRVSRSGTVPVSMEHDTIGPMGFTTYDVALMLEIMAGADERDPYTSNSPSVPRYTNYATNPPPLSSFTIGIPAAHFLYDTSFDIPQSCVAENAKAFKETIAQMKKLGTRVEWGTEIDLRKEEVADFLDVFTRKVNGDFKVDLEAYLSDLEESKVRTMVDLIQFNDLHSAEELPPHECCQERLIDSLVAPTRDTNSTAYRNAALQTMKYADEKGFGGVFRRYPDLDFLAIPFELGMPGLWVGAGQFPAAVVPLGYCPSGLPFGMMFIARHWNEHRLIEIMAAYQKEPSLPNRRPPSLLTEDAQWDKSEECLWIWSA